MRQTVGALVFLGVGAIAAGVIAFSKGLPALRLTVFELPYWKSVEAVVLKTEVVAGDASGLSTPGSRASGAGRTVYKPRVSYRYLWEGREYTGNRFSLLESSSDDEMAQRIRLQRYAVGKAVTVYVNPADPSQAVINRDDLFNPALVSGIGGLFVLVGAGLLVTLVVVVRRGAKDTTGSAE